MLNILLQMVLGPITAGIKTHSVPLKLKSPGSFLPTNNFKILQNLFATQSSYKEK